MSAERGGGGTACLRREGGIARLQREVSTGCLLREGGTAWLQRQGALHACRERRILHVCREKVIMHAFKRREHTACLQEVLYSGRHLLYMACMARDQFAGRLHTPENPFLHLASDGWPCEGSI